MTTISRHGRRHWAVYLNNELIVADCLQKRRAVAVCNIVESALALASRAVLPAAETLSAAA